MDTAISKQSLKTAKRLIKAHPSYNENSGAESMTDDKKADFIKNTFLMFKAAKGLS